MTKRGRIILAFILAPISFGVFSLLISAFSSSLADGFWVLMFSAAVGYPIAIFLGIPIFLFLARLNVNGIHAYLGIAFVFALLLIAYFVVWPALTSRAIASELFLPSRILQIFIIYFGCFITVIVFWAIARPDKQD